jgi:hypothetical protein
MRLVWNDEKSVRTWLEGVSVAMHGIADMAKSLAGLVDSAMPPAPGGPESPASTGRAPEPRSCSFCGKTEAETRLCAGGWGNICEPCTRTACGVFGIALEDDAEPCGAAAKESEPKVK